jgi:hypothetical protein
LSKNGGDLFPSKQIPAPSSIENSFQLPENFFHFPHPFFTTIYKIEIYSNNYIKKSIGIFLAEKCTEGQNQISKRSLCGKNTVGTTCL